MPSTRSVPARGKRRLHLDHRARRARPRAAPRRAAKSASSKPLRGSADLEVRARRRACARRGRSPPAPRCGWCAPRPRAPRRARCRRRVSAMRQPSGRERAAQQARARARASCARSAPPARRSTRSARAAATGECVTISAAAPARRTASREAIEHAPRRSPRRGCRWARRRAAGAGEWTSARAIATRCISPPESVPGRRAAEPPRPTAAEQLRRARRALGAAPRRAARAAAPRSRAR